jgi:phosphotriesterase-related protein
VDPQVDQLKEICSRGANLQIDHIGIPWQHESEGADPFDERMAEAICRVVDLGFLDRLTFTYDRFFHHCRGPINDEAPELLNERVDFAYLFESFIPRLEKRGWTKAEFDQVLIDNPRRLLAI